MEEIEILNNREIQLQDQIHGSNEKICKINDNIYFLRRKLDNIRKKKKKLCEK